MSALNICSTDALTFAINAHKRLAFGLPLTNYCQWCRSVHNAKHLTPQEKFDRILSWDINPSEYDNPTLFASDWQLFKLLSKIQVTDKIPQSYIDVAHAKFTDAEDRCQLVNELYSRRVLPRGISQLLEDVKRTVSTVLGDITDFFSYVERLARDDPSYSLRFDRFSKKYDRARYFEAMGSQGAKYGPGVSVGAEDDSLSSIGEKLVFGTVTANCAYLGNWLSSLWHIPHCRVVPGSVLTYVPKKVGEARAICYEPSMNMLVQKLIGLYIKYRLKIVCGINLRSQHRNQMLARLGSLCDSYATADQTSASDLFAYKFVLDSLPFEWFRLLDDARSPAYKSLDGKWHYFQKFSTMGNGFTFELETLLFAAIVKHACDRDRGEHGSTPWNEVSIYGDDIIFPKDHYRAVQQALLVCGHIPNLKKSFASGPFRESCGGDFFLGWNVTPFKIMEVTDLEKDIRPIVNMYNGMASRHLCNPHNLSLYGWITSYLNFVKNWLFNHHAKLSHGPVESRVTYDGSLSYEPTNRWLWDLDNERRNFAYCRAYQTALPKWLLVEKRYTIDYHVCPEAAKYFAANGFSPFVVETRVGFMRNPAFRDSRKTSHSVLHEGIITQQRVSPQ